MKVYIIRMRDIYKILDALLVPAKVCIRKEII
nr:MAG TPA: hypothetical protein [Caudoviricetes sp.]